jgi:hypothetical protein
MYAAGLRSRALHGVLLLVVSYECHLGWLAVTGAPRLGQRVADRELAAWPMQPCVDLGRFLYNEGMAVCLDPFHIKLDSVDDAAFTHVTYMLILVAHRQRWRAR